MWVEDTGRVNSSRRNTMLELKNIVKTYETAGENVEALRGIDLQFRTNEFVSILGQSGCGKTTMLNIIGGLDKYTSGDLVINGKSTKQYKDRDWDTYRNHYVGFVFQTYNLIPHQTVLQNVEIALTIAGVSKSERRRRAKEALEKVGLGNQLKKRPSQMSGGQMQRVAIARALVNNPEIILADEPTGALDTETSIQVMDILKEVAKEKLVIMVTHNPELAEKYSTRIVRMLDGQITSDSKPLTDDEYAAEYAAGKQKLEEERKKKRPSMSLITSFGLSLKNLFTKKGRTLLTSFAGSIGIIGIALIYAVSQGTTNYINSVQEETLSSYPLSIRAQSVDLSSLITSFMGNAQSVSEHENDAVYQKALIYNMVNSLSNVETKQNDLKAFKAYIEEQMKDEDSKFSKSISAIRYSYGLNMTVYTKNKEGEVILSDTEKLLSSLMEEYFGYSSGYGSGGLSAGMSAQVSSNGLWRELIPGNDGKLISTVTEKQYDLVYGSWPASYDQVVLFLDEHNEVDDLTLYALGLKTEEEVGKIMEAARDKKSIDYNAEKWSYEDICNLEFKVVLPYECYSYDEATGTYKDLRETETGLEYLYDKAMQLKVTGIVKPSEKAVSSNDGGGIGYTSKLVEYIIKNAAESEVVKAQKENENTDIFTNLPFRPAEKSMTDAQKAVKFKDYVAELDDRAKMYAYMQIASLPDEAAMAEFVSQKLDSMSRAEMEQTLVQALVQQSGMSEDMLKSYLSEMSDEDIKKTFTSILEEQYKAQYRMQVMQQMSALTPEQILAAFDDALAKYTDEECARYYDEIITFSESSYKDNLRTLGNLDLDNPSGINLYSASFAGKDMIEEGIADYNKGVEEELKIEYTDYIGLILSSVTTIINAITYVLIAFVGVSLVVSSIMIGVITLISVQERTKEIGILRAIGASKRNVSSMFNAETVIIGFASGFLGVVITMLLCIPINLILHAVTGIQNLSAVLPIPTAIILIIISMLLTLIAGIIPSRSAAKKDPVVALRTE